MDDQIVYAVTSYDLGGNSGLMIEGIFATREAAETYIGADVGVYEIDEYSLWSTAPEPYTYWHRGAAVYPDKTVEDRCVAHTAKGPPPAESVRIDQPFPGHMQGHCGLHISIFGEDREAVEQAYQTALEQAFARSTGVCVDEFRPCGRTRNWKRTWERDS